MVMYGVHISGRTTSRDKTNITTQQGSIIRDSAVVDATGARERPPKRAPMRTAVPVHVRLDPRVARRDERDVARLERESVD